MESSVREEKKGRLVSFVANKRHRKFSSIVKEREGKIK
jgi:hypothetical protein